MIFIVVSVLVIVALLVYWKRTKPTITTDKLHEEKIKIKNKEIKEEFDQRVKEYGMSHS